MKTILKLAIGCLFLISCSATNKIKESATQNEYFEGTVTYKTSSVRPEMIPEKDWNERIKEIFGDQGYMLQKNYYKPNQFASEINTGLAKGKQVYNPIDSLHYGWQLNTEVVQTEDKRIESFVKIKEVIKLDTTAMISNIECKAARVNLSLGYALVWYHPEILKFKANEYVGVLFQNKTIQEIGRLPIKIEVPGMLEIQMVEYSEEKLDDEIFKIPEFK